MGLIDRLKRWHYRNRFGIERAELILRIERELATLPKGAIDPEWLWSLPEEAWLDAVALQRDYADMMAKREDAVQKITLKNRLLTMLNQPDDYAGRLSIDDLEERAKAAVLEVERIKLDIGEQERRIRETANSLENRYGAAMPGISHFRKGRAEGRDLA